MATDWSKCCICQLDKTGNLRSKDNSYVKLAERLPKFKEAGGAELLDLSRIDDGTGILNTLRKNNAVYHKDCYSEYNEYHLLRCQDSKKRRVNESAPSETPVSRKRSKSEIGSNYCIFCGETDLRDNLCAAGELHTGTNTPNNSHVESLTESWKEMALQLGELDMHTKLSMGDVRSSEIFYHKLHLVNFRNRYRDSLGKKERTEEKRSTSLLGCYAMKQIVIHMHQASETFIDVAELEKKYQCLLEAYNIPYSPHISRFIAKLKYEIPELIDHTIGRKKYVSFKNKLDKEANKILMPEETLVEVMKKVAEQIRAKLINTRKTFGGTFDKESAENAVPAELLILINLLVSGNSDNVETGFSLPVKTISESIMYNHRKENRKGSTEGPHRHSAEKETPVLQYIALKLYVTTRSRYLIDVFHKHGLCVSYDRVLRLTQGLSEASLQLFESEDAVVPGNLRKGVFCVGAKDNIDKNSSCTVSKSHYHGTSLSLFQFPSVENKGIERNYDKFINIDAAETKKVRELPCFYTDFKEIKDPPATFFASIPTVNAPDEMIDSTEIIKLARDNEFEWLEYIADKSEFVPDTSWSVYHSRREVASENVQCINSILPLLRQNVRSFSMQKHCIEITKAAIDVLNPGQVIVDVSDQPIYTISRQLQQLFPNEFGPGKYVPMFGGLHIE